MPTAARPTPIDLADDVDFVAFSIRGYEFDVDPYEAGDRLTQIDRAHATDPNTCLACGHQFPPAQPAADQEPAKLVCPACASDLVQPCQSYLDDVAKLLTEHYGTPRCTRQAAAQFYRVMVEKMVELKKKTGSTPESDTGSESTPEIGATAESVPG